MELLKFTHQSPSQLVPSVHHGGPDGVSSDQIKAPSSDTLPILGSGGGSDHSHGEYSDQKVSGECSRGEETIMGKKTVTDTEETKMKTATIVESCTIYPNGTSDVQDDPSRQILKAVSSKERRELLLIAELREKAQKLKKNSLRRFVSLFLLDFYFLHLTNRTQ